MRYERIPTEEPIRHLWNRLDVLASVTGATTFIKRRAEEQGIQLEDDILEEKSRGLAFCIRSAREYFNTKIEGNITSASLAYYYGTFSLLKALLITKIENPLSLKSIEEYTKYGHGLKSYVNEGVFPESEYIIILTNGFFAKFLSIFGYVVRDIGISTRYNTFSDLVNGADAQKIISFKDLVSRIPEISGMFIELFNEQPRYLAYNALNHPDHPEIEVKFQKNSEYIAFEDVYDILGWDDSISLCNYDEYGEQGIKTITKIDKNLIVNKQTHSSVLSQTCYVKPLHGINDVLLLDFMLLYHISIWVRYRPALWRELIDGEHDKYRSLITNFMIAVERVVPNLVLDRLYNKRHLFAGFSYWS
ncbi:YaaC family protein [Paenibacillus sambharensis]|nr:YaaC family protein [Paenibacillus sambharensis]